MKRLRLCHGCARHVFVTERACPFCQCSLEPAPQRAPVPIASSASRAQRLALAAALGSQGLLACAQTSGTDPGDVAMPVYGAPLAGNWAGPTAGSAPPAAGSGGAVDAGVSFPVYGAPLAGQPAPQLPRPDAGVPDAGGIDEDAGVDEAAAGAGGGMAVPVYGAPIPEYGAPPPPAKD